MQKYLYLTILFCSVLVPFIFSFHKRLKFYLHFKSLGFGLALMLLLFIPHDIWYTSLKIWGFNSKYLIDIASQLDGEKIEIFFNDSGSPALIKDPSDFDSIYVVMPMKG